jgi:hypothetical protein
MGRRTGIAGVSVMLCVMAAGCGASKQSHAQGSTAGGDPQQVQVRCAPAPLRRGAPPAWAAGAPTQIPFALARGARVAAFFFVYPSPLRTGHPGRPTNKILWVVGAPRQGKPLKIVARLFGKRRSPVRFSWPANSSPGEIYPSIIDLPAPGCWRLALAWAGHHATIDVNVVRGR